MDREPGISVVIPCFNAERYVGAAIRSALAQTELPLEVIVVDDGSTDGSAALVRREFGGRADVRLVQQGNRGVAAARNEGIRQANGKWIAFLDADDIWMPGKLQAQRACLALHPEARMVYAAWHVWTSSAPQPNEAELEAVAQDDGEAIGPGPSGWIYPDLLLDCVVWTSTVLVDRSLIDENGAFDETLRIGEDYDLWLRLSRVTPIVKVQRPLAFYRLHPSSTTRGAPKTNHRGVVVTRAIHRWGYASPDGRAAAPAVVQRSLGRSWSDFAGAHLEAGNLATARAGAMTALRTFPLQLLAWSILAKFAVRSLADKAKLRGQ